MKTKSLIVLGGVLAASAVTVIVMKNRNAETFSGKAAEVGQILLKEVPYETAATFAVTDSKGSVEITKKDGKWVVANRDNFPANVTAVNELSDSAFNLKVQRVEKGIGASQYPRLGLAAAGSDAKGDELAKTVTIKDASGKELGGLVVGKIQEVKADNNTMDFSQPQPRPQWIKVAGGDVIYLTATGFSRLEADAKGWLDKEKFFAVAKHKSVSVAGPTPEETWKLTRDKDAAELKLEAPAAGEEFDASKASAQGGVFSSINFDDILPDAEKAKAALDKPTHTITIETFEGLTYTVKIGAKVEPPKPDAVPDPKNPPPTPTEAYYVSFTVSGKLDETPPAYTTPAPVLPPEPAVPAALAADANDEAKKKHEEDTKAYDTAKKQYEETKKNHESAVKSWEESKKNADEQFKKDLQTKKDKLAAEQALSARTFVVQKYVLEPVMKKRTDLMKDKPAPPPPAPGTAPASANSPSVSVAPVPTPPNPGGKIEAVTPPIEVRVPGAEGKIMPKDGDKPSDPVKPAAGETPAPAAEAKAAPAEPEGKKPRKKNK